MLLKRLGYFVLSLLVILILSLIFFNLNLTYNFISALKPTKGDKFSLAKSLPYRLSPSDSDHLVYQLPIATAVYPIFKGKVIRIVDSSGIKNIQIVDSQGKIVSYLIAGDILVKENQEVSTNTKIAVINSDNGPSVLAGGNLGIYIFINGQFVSAAEVLK